MELIFCSFGCKHAKAEKATSAGKSCMTFNSVYCKKLKKRISKWTICPVEKAKLLKP